MWKALSSHSSLASICILAILLVGAYVCYKISTLPLKESAGQHAKRETLVKPSPSSLRASERASQPVVFKESEYPDNWWNGKDVFDLERRAIFSKVSLQDYNSKHVIAHAHAHVSHQRHGCTFPIAAASPSLEITTHWTSLAFRSF